MNRSSTADGAENAKNTAACTSPDANAVPRAITQPAPASAQLACACAAPRDDLPAASPALPDERTLQAALGREFEKYGYIKYKMRKFEPYALYLEHLPFLKDEHVLTFSDPDGALMALKPDVTLSIAKNAGDGDKLYYVESVYRVARQSRAFREIPQMGLECVGRVDAATTLEVTLLALKSLRLAGGRCALDVGHMGYLAALMDDMGCSPTQREAISRLLGGKNAHELRAYCEKSAIPEDLADALITLISLRGDMATTIEKARALVRNDVMLAAVDELSALSDALCALGMGRGVSLDFSIINDFDYYNGIVLRGYIEGVPRAVLAGGRYDPLLRRLGRRGEAMGFALYLDELSDRMRKQSAFDVDVLCLYDERADAARLTRALNALREEGLTVRAAVRTPENLRYNRLTRFEDGQIKEVSPC